MWDALSEERTGLYNRCWPSPAQSFSGPSLDGLMAIFHCLRFETPPQSGGPAPLFISPRNRVAQLYPQAMGSLLVAIYDSQGGGIRPRLHTGELKAGIYYK
jgi:hypothetical protein